MSLLTMILLLVTAIAVLGQSDQRVKKPRVESDYRPRTMAEIMDKSKLAGLAIRESRDFVPDGENRPSRVRLVYGGKQRPIPANRARMIELWACRFAGSVEFYTKSYDTEARFVEKGRTYWLPVNRALVARLESKTGHGAQVDAFVIKLGGAVPGKPAKCVLLVERIANADDARG
jgi:hypothetical protein